MLTSILIPFPPKYYKEFVAKNMILLVLFILRLCFKTENLFGAQFDELEKCN